MVVYNRYLFVDTNWAPEIISLDVAVRLFVVTPLLFLYFPARHYAVLVAPQAGAIVAPENFTGMRTAAAIWAGRGSGLCVIVRTSQIREL
ncbi:hypothetical protein [Rhizobium rhizogenes]|uniref:hypothetical protein n=1 Tax=Rhizobium rhizogenes TaxID=359 RepID=UPI0022C8F387|nr:hypothetical protein [Rhizobium rhizogenes]MCZ7463445.1 hypothetical protein [Rhizobium rhizogenes]